MNSFVVFALFFHVLLCILCAWAAGEKNRSALAWFLISLVFSPVIGLLGLIAVPVKK